MVSVSTALRNLESQHQRVRVSTVVLNLYEGEFLKQNRPFARIASRFLAIYLIAIGVHAPGLSQTGSAGLPQLGDGQEMTLAAERRLGDSIARSIYRDPDYLDDPLLTAYLDSLWQPLMRAARARGDISPELSERFAWELMTGRDRSINAFALPGGYFGIHLGLMAAAGSRDELASVLAHELSHVSQRHIARLIDKQQQLQPWVIGAMILGAIAASKNPEAGNAVLAGSQAAGTQAQLNFSRDMEREADRVGYAVLADAGFNPQGFVGLFDKLQQANRINDNGSFPYLRTHPLTSERIGDMQARLQLDPARPAGADTAAERRTHALMAARARVLSNPGVDALRSELSSGERLLTRQDVGDAKDLVIAQLYGSAVAALKLREPLRAQALINKAMSVISDEKQRFARMDIAQYAIELIAIEAQLAQQQTDAARQRMDALVQARTAGELPRPVLLMWAQQKNSRSEATELASVADALQTRVASQPRDALAWEALARIQQLQGQSLRAIRSEAEARLALMDHSAALDRLKAAQELARRSGANHIEASIIDARTRVVTAQMRELQADRRP
jgi:predicted Zn-dependent protease